METAKIATLRAIAALNKRWLEETVQHQTFIECSGMDGAAKAETNPGVRIRADIV